MDYPSDPSALDCLLYFPFIPYFTYGKRLCQRNRQVGSYLFASSPAKSSSYQSLEGSDCHSLARVHWIHFHCCCCHRLDGSRWVPIEKTVDLGDPQLSTSRRHQMLSRMSQLSHRSRSLLHSGNFYFAHF